MHTSGNQIGVDGARMMADALVHENSRLTSIDLRCEFSCDYTGCDVCLLCQASGNRIEVDGALVLVDAIVHSNCHLISIDLEGKWGFDETIVVVN